MAIIDKPGNFFNTKLYTGTGSSNAVTGVGFKPDLVWLKKRSATDNNYLFDVVRGVTKYIRSNLNNVEATDSGSLSAFGSDGFTVVSEGDINANNATMASWNWKAGNSQGSSNTAGSINTAYTSVNTTAGFSISKYTGTGSAGATVGHGLGVAPKMIIVKGLTYADVWIVGGDNLGGWNKEMYLNSTSAVATNNNAFNGVAPTSSVFTLGSGNGANKSGDTYIAYCFAEKTGYSKFGSYVGNGNADGPFVYTGMKPSFVMTKPLSSTGDWYMHDNKRDGYNSVNDYLKANATDAESNNDPRIDLLSNGFKFTTTHSTQNSNNVTYIYMAFGQSIVGTNNVPNNAR